MSMKEIIKFILKFIISAFLAIAVLSIFNLAYAYTGIHIDNPTGATDYVWEQNQLKTSMGEGFAWMVMDENGFNNHPEYSRQCQQSGIDNLIMGSSNMEAVQVSQKENVAYLLNEKFEEKNTYNIGISGHDLYRIMDNVATAVRYYKPADFLLIETKDIVLDEQSMRAVIDQTASKIPSYDSGVIYYMQKIPAVKWLYKSMEDWISQSQAALLPGGSDAASEMKTEEIIPASYEDTLTEFLGLCAQAVEDTACTPVIFYHPHAVVNTDGSVEFDSEKEYLKLFAAACEKNGILFVDMTEDFEKNYKENFTLPHGFINSYVGTGHLNSTGHQIIADKLEDIMLQYCEER